MLPGLEHPTYFFIAYRSLAFATLDGFSGYFGSPPRTGLRAVEVRLGFMSRYKLIKKSGLAGHGWLLDWG